MIAGLAMLMTVILQNAGNQNYFNGLQWLLLGAIFLIVSIVAIVNKTRSHYHDGFEFEKVGFEMFIASWSFDKKQWAEFVRHKFERDKRYAAGLALITAIVFGFASVFLISNDLRIDFAILSGLLLSFLGFLLGRFFGRLNADRKFEKLISVKDPQLHFTEGSIIYNSQLILLGDLGCKMTSFSIQSNSDMKTFMVIVECGLGRWKSKKKYILPIPSNKTEEAETLVRHYESHLAF